MQLHLCSGIKFIKLYDLFYARFILMEFVTSDQTKELMSGRRQGKRALSNVPSTRDKWL